MYLIFLTLSIIFSSLLFSQQSFKDFKRQQEQAFSQYKESVTKEYDAYEVAEKAAYEKFKENMERQWEEFKGSSAKTYVSYDEDLQSRASIDYENGHLVIEVIIDEETADIEGINYYKGNERNSYQFGHLAFHVDNLDKVISEVERRDWWYRKSKSSSSNYIFIKDPDGYDIEIIEKPFLN